jgi:hypothetical protein
VVQLVHREQVAHREHRVQAEQVEVVEPPEHLE